MGRGVRELAEVGRWAGTGAVGRSPTGVTSAGGPTVLSTDSKAVVGGWDFVVLSHSPTWPLSIRGPSQASLAAQPLTSWA